MRKIEVVKYDPGWVKKFNEEESILEKIFKENVENIFHIGSTSVPGLSAKAVIDLLIVVKDLQKVDSKNEEMIQAGYEPKGEFGIKNRRYFPKGGDNRSHHVHIFQKEDSNIIRHLAFKEYLKYNNKRMKEYELLKIELARKFPHDIDGYCNGKDFLIKKIEKEALSWYESKELTENCKGR